MRDHASACRVHINTLREFQQINFTIHNAGPIAAFPYRASTVVGADEKVNLGCHKGHPTDYSVLSILSAYSGLGKR